MKIDKDKLERVLKSKKAMIMVMLVSILITIAFYGTAYALGYFGVTTGVGLLEGWGSIFLMITIGIGGYIYIILDDTMFSKQKSKKNEKSKPKPKIDQKVEVKQDVGESVECVKVEGMNCNSMNSCDESKTGINIAGDSVCPECQGETEIRIRGTSRKIVCIDCGVVIKEYVITKQKPEQAKEETVDESIAKGNCPFDDSSCVHIDMDGDCHGVCARLQEMEIKKNPDVAVPDPKDTL